MRRAGARRRRRRYIRHCRDPPSAPASVPELQLYPGAQSAAVVHPLVHAAFTQAWGAQVVLELGTHLPLPSHFETPTSVAVPAVQAAAAQVVPNG